MRLETRLFARTSTTNRLQFWNGMSYRFLGSISAWKVWYGIVFAIVGIVANIGPVFDPAMNNPSNNIMQAFTPATVFFALTSLLYILLSLAAIPILGWTYYKGLRTGTKLLAPPSDAHERFSPSFLRVYRLVSAVFLYIFIPLAALGLFALFGVISSLLSPHFASDQHVPSAAHHILRGVGMALLASLEELWRWAMIASVLYVAKLISHQRWTRSSRYRWWAFLIAILISSFFFGMAHVAEFNVNYRTMALVVLGGSGILLAGVAVVTRRFWLAMLVHAIYDFLAMTNLFGTIAPYLLIGALTGIVAVFPAFYKLYGRVQGGIGGQDSL